MIYAGSQAGALAAKQATDTISIVFVGVTSPVELGLVSSLSHPGANVTEPRRFHLIVNLATARSLGLTLPPSVPLRAYKVIE